MQEQDTQVLALPDKKTTARGLQNIRDFQAEVKEHLIEGHDFGVIPGTSKPTLLKPGAEKITKLLYCSADYILVDVIRDWDKGFFHYEHKCILTHIPTGKVFETGVGECNSMEERYRWRKLERKCPTCGAEAIIKGKDEYGGGWLCWKKRDGCGAKFQDGDEAIEGQPSGRVENPDSYSLVNTILKMSKKRALVDAALSAGRLSDLFTQDMEGATVVIEGEVVTPDEPEPAQAPKRHTKPMPGRFCIKHQVWVKPITSSKSKMTGFAHKEASEPTGWCVLPDEAADPVETQPEAPTVESSAVGWDDLPKVLAEHGVEQDVFEIIIGKKIEKWQSEGRSYEEALDVFLSVREQ